MERIAEENPDIEYRAYQHFISNSNWDCEGLQKNLALDCSELLFSHKVKSKKPTGYIIDESAHLKKGKKSVGFLGNMQALLVRLIIAKQVCIAL